MALICAIAASAWAQSNADLAALEARLMARLDRRLAGESVAPSSRAGAVRGAFREAVRSLSTSGNELDQKVLVAIDKGAVEEGVGVLEERAKARDAAAVQPNANLQSVRQQRAGEWKKIGALAFLDNTDRAISAYQEALRFAPADPAVLEQLGELYMRQARWPERISVGERLASLKDLESQAKGYYNIADSYLELGEPAKAGSKAARCIEIAQLGTVARFESRCWSLLAGVRAQQQKFPEAEELANKALTIARTNGYEYERGMALYILAATGEMRAATLPAAERSKGLQEVDGIYDELEQVASKIDDPGALPNILVNRARFALALGNAPLAETRLRKALTIMENLGATARMSYTHQELGMALVAQGRVDEAIPYFQSSVAKAKETKQPAYEAMALLEWAAAEAGRSHPAEACQLAMEARRVYMQGVPEAQSKRQVAEQQVKQFCR